MASFIDAVNTSVVYVLLSTLPVVGCDVRPTTAPATRPATTSTQPREWRITEALDPAEVNADVLPPGSTTTIAYVEQPGLIRIVLPDGEAHEAEPYLVQAAQETQRLTYLRLLFPSESLDSAVARAEVMLDEWGVVTPEYTKRLAEWHAERAQQGYQRGPYSAGLHISFNSTMNQRFPRQVEIRPSYDSNRPWYVAVGVSFYGERERQRNATSQPATEQAGT